MSCCKLNNFRLAYIYIYQIMSNLPVVVDKLGHSLEEIRLRALNNLLTKLDCGLLAENELLDQDGLFTKLLNWFDFETVSEKEKVLKLILNLVKAKDGGGRVLLLRADPGLVRLRALHDHDIIVQDIIKIVTNECNADQYQPIPDVENTKPPVIFTFKESLEREVKSPSRLSSKNDLASCFHVWSLPWMPLVHSDIHVLSAVEESFCDDENALQSCQFFINVVLQDFPPEVFLQRPNILKAIIDLLKKPSPLNSAAAECLSHFTQGLHRRLNSLCDPSMVSFKFENFEEDIKAESTLESNSTNSSQHQDDCSNKNYSSGIVTELSVPQYCIVALINVIDLSGSCKGISSPLIPSLLQLFSSCLANKKLIWTSPHPVLRDLNHHMHTALIILASTVQNSFVEEPIKQLHMVTTAVQILKTLVPSSLADTSVPPQLQQNLTQCLLDPAMTLMYPQVHKLLFKYVKAFKKNGEKLFVDTKQVMDSMTASAEFTKSAFNLVTTEALQLLDNALLSLPFHKQFDLISLFMQLCTDLWRLTEDELAKASRIARSLLAHTDTDIVTDMYRVCQEKVITLLGPMQAARTTNPIQAVSVLLNSSLLLEIVCHGMTSNNPKVKEAAQDIVIHIIKCRLLVPQTSWDLVLEQILPIMPLLQCHASKDTPLGRCILNMTDPDVAKATSIPKLQVVSSNIRLLLHKNTLCREEGCARTQWMLNLSRPSSPRLQDICIIEKAIVNKPPSVGLYEIGSVVRVLEVLTGPFVEARVRQSALVQLSVMTEDTRLHDVFMEQKGLTILLHILQSSVDEWYEDVKDYVIPIVTVMKNLARYNSKVRLQLTQSVSFYLCILKGLFLLSEWRLQRDATQLLALLVFADFVISTAENISFPQLVVDSYCLPFVCHTHWTVSPHSQPTNKGELLGNKPCQTLLGIHWAVVKEGNIDKVLNWARVPDDLSVNLSIPLQSLRHVQESAISYNCQKLLYNVQNATTHKSATEAIQKLRSYLELGWLTNSNNLTGLPWQDTFNRFLITTPSCSEDYHLLLLVLEFLIFLVDLLKDRMDWVPLGLQATPQPLLNFLFDISIDKGNEHINLKEEACMKLLNLSEMCMKQGIDCGWSYLVKVIMRNLDNSHEQQFYSLGLLANKLRCLQRQLSLHSIDSTVLWILLSAFHCDIPQSCMGLSITRHTLYCLNNLLAFVVTNQVWEVHWTKEENLRWLPYLLLSRDVLVRASTLQLLAGMCTSKIATAAVLQSIETIWDQALKFVVDHMEASLVREQAAILCTNISSNTKGQVCVTSAMEAGLCREFAVTVTQLSQEDIVDLDFISQAVDNSIKAESDVSVYDLLPTTPGLVTAGCWFVNNLMALNKQEILTSIQQDGLEGALFRCLLELKSIRSNECVKMYTIICNLLCHSVSSNSITAAQVAPAVMRLLDTSSFDEVPEKCDSAIKKLWLEGWRLLSAILFFSEINTTLPTPVIVTLCESICQSADSALQLSALLAVPALTYALDDENAVTVCQSLLDQWHTVSGKKRTALVQALTCIVGSGQETSTVAFDKGLLHSLVTHLREILVGLTIKTGNIQHLKKGNQLLSDLEIHLGLACNFLAGDGNVKLAAAELGFADILHKLWVWCQIDDQLMLLALHTLITFTADCPQSSQTLVLTSTMSGVGQRKTPSSHSFIHCLIVLLTKEQHQLEIKKCSLVLLSHACQAHECRVVIAKSNLLQFWALTWQDKKQISEQTEIIWLQFLNIFTSFSEGQQALPKVGDLLNSVIQCAANGREKSRTYCVYILRNISFDQLNKSRLLTIEPFLALLGEKLLSGNDDEKYNICLIIWSLAANSQKAKVVLRSKGLCSRLQLLEAVQSDELFTFVRNLLLPVEGS